MPCQEGNEGCQEYNHEERQAGNSGYMPRMRDQDVPNRKKLKLRLRASKLLKRLGIYAQMPSFFINDYASQNVITWYY